MPARRKSTSPKAGGAARSRRPARAASADGRAARAERSAAERAPVVRGIGLGTLKPAPGSRHRKKRRGLGPASGLGGTAGRGHKGQRARSGGKVARWFEGGQMPIQRRVPKRGFTNVLRVQHQIVNVAHLARFGAGDVVNRETLKAKRLIDRSDLPVKILGTGDVALALQVAVDAVSASARAKIEGAGGSITLPEKRTPRPRGVKKPARSERS